MSSNIIPFPVRRPVQTAIAVAAKPQLRPYLVPTVALVEVTSPAIGLLDELGIWAGRLGQRMVAFSTYRAAQRMRSAR